MAAITTTHYPSLLRKVKEFSFGTVKIENIMTSYLDTQLLTKAIATLRSFKPFKNKLLN